MTSDYDLLTGSIGVKSATALLVGNVVGISIFTLPGPLAASAGPAVAVGILLAAVPLSFGILMTFQLGSAIPVAGGNYVYGSRMVHPFAGFLVPWLVVPAVWAGLLFVGVGFAEYVGVFVALPDLVLVYGLYVSFLALNVAGIRPLARFQVLMVVALVGSMLTFVVPGMLAVDPANYAPLLPNGIAPFAVAVVSLYYPLRGFSMIADLGEELDNPAHAIPRVLLYSAAISLTMFVAVVVVLVGVLNWQTLGDAEAAVVVAAGSFLPSPLVWLVALGAVVGGLSSISTTYTGFSRSLMRAARDHVFPSRLAAVHPRFGTPHLALFVLGVPPMVLAPLDPSPVILSIYLTLAVLTSTVVRGVALWRLPTVFPERYQMAPTKLPIPVLRAVAVLGVLSALGLMFVVAAQIPWIIGLYVAYSTLGYLVYRLRIRQLAATGTDLKALLSDLADHE